MKKIILILLLSVSYLFGIELTKEYRIVHKGKVVITVIEEAGASITTVPDNLDYAEFDTRKELLDYMEKNNLEFDEGEIK